MIFPLAPDRGRPAREHSRRVSLKRPHGLFLPAARNAAPRAFRPIFMTDPVRFRWDLFDCLQSIRPPLREEARRQPILCRQRRIQISVVAPAGRPRSQSCSSNRSGKGSARPIESPNRTGACVRAFEGREPGSRPICAGRLGRNERFGGLRGRRHGRQEAPGKGGESRSTCRTFGGVAHLVLESAASDAWKAITSRACSVPEISR